MSANSVVRVIQGLSRRIIRLTCIKVFVASKHDSRLSSVDGFTLLRVTQANAKENQKIIEEAMREAGEPDGLITPRFMHGDEFFGWMNQGRVVSFGWVTYKDRTVGPVRFTDKINRVFLFNFYTLQEYRGRGLYSALLVDIRTVLRKENRTEFIIDVNAKNETSLKGIQKAGFISLTEFNYITIFNCWSFASNRTVI